MSSFVRPFSRSTAKISNLNCVTGSQSSVSKSFKLNILTSGGANSGTCHDHNCPCGNTNGSSARAMSSLTSGIICNHSDNCPCGNCGPSSKTVKLNTVTTSSIRPMSTLTSGIVCNYSDNCPCGSCAPKVNFASSSRRMSTVTSGLMCNYTDNCPCGNCSSSKVKFNTIGTSIRNMSSFTSNGLSFPLCTKQDNCPCGNCNSTFKLNKTNIRSFSTNNGTDNNVDNPDPYLSLGPPKNISLDDGRRKQLAWRAKQRGWLELDWLIGSFADKHLANLESEELLNEFEKILEMDNPELYKWLSGQSVPPEEVGKNTVYRMMVGYVNKDHPEIQKQMWTNNQNLS